MHLFVKIDILVDILSRIETEMIACERGSSTDAFVEIV